MTPPNDPLLLALLDEDDWLRRRAVRLARDTHVAEDLVQEVWLAALKNRPDPRRKLQPWLERVLQSQHALSLRKRSRHTSEDLAETMAFKPKGHSEQVRQEERLAILFEAIAGLEEPYRSTLRQRFFESRTVAEIADLHGQQPTTVRTRVHRGLVRLRKALKRAGVGLGAWFTLPRKTATQLAAACGMCLVAVSLLIPTFFGGASRAVQGSQLASEARTAEPQNEDSLPAIQTDRVQIQGVLPMGPEPPPRDGLARDGVLFDQDGQLAVAHSTIEILMDGVRMPPLVTDENGRFEWPAEWEGREVILEIEASTGERIPRFARVPYVQSWRIERFSGPVLAFELENAAPERARDLHWILRSSVPFAGSVHVGPSPDGTHLIAQLGTDGVWYGSPVTSLRLHGESADGLEGASAPLSLAALDGGERLQLKIGPTARLYVYHSTALDHRTAVHLSSLDDRGLSLHFPPDGIDPSLTLSDEMLRPGFLGGLPAGRYLLSWNAPGRAPEEIEVELRAGETRMHTIYPREVRAANDQVVVRLDSDSGQYTRSVFAVLEGEDGTQFLPAEWKADEGRMRAVITFTDVAASDHELRIVPIADYMRWDHYKVHVHPGAATQTFLCHDQAPRDVLDFDLCTEEDGELPAELAARIRVEIQVEAGPLYSLFLLPAVADTPRRWSLASERLSWLTRERAMPNVAQDAMVSWSLFVDDSKVTSGNEQAFGVPEDGIREARVVI
ncbi:MAG: RNA polymerase sigma factor, partial [Planctomycetota bacterium]